MKRSLAVPVIALAVLAACKTTDKPSQSVPAAPDITTTTDAPTTDAPTTAAPTIAAAPQTLLELSGSGSKTTQKFTAAGDWDLAWTYNCANFGGSGNFQVFITADDPSTLVTPVNQLGASGSSVEHYHDAGTFYFEVNSECNWTVKVTG